MVPPLALLNTTILTRDGWHDMYTISLVEARSLFNSYQDNFISAIGHESTVQMLNTLLNTNTIKMNRIAFRQEYGQKALCFKLNGRPEEGKILALDELVAIGYEFKVIECMEPEQI